MRNQWKGAVLLFALFLIVIHGCAPKIYRSSYSDPEFDFDRIETMVIVLEDAKLNNPLFAEIFIQTAVERQRFTLIQENYVLEEEISKQELLAGVDAFLKISLTHCYPGFRTRFSPTSIGAYAKLIETGSGKTLWNMNYAYSSATGGSSAPMIEEVMKIVAKNLIDSVPIGATPFFAIIEEALEEEQLEEQKDVLAEAETPKFEEHEDVLAKAAALEVEPKVEEDYEEKAPEIEPESPAPIEQKDEPAEQEPVLVEIPFKNGTYLVHAASVRVKRKSAADEFINRKTKDGTTRLALLVDLQSKGSWYRLLIGRFKSLDACRSYIRKLKKGGEIDKDAHPVELPFSLLIRSGQESAPLQEMVNVLREKGFPSYLSPPVGTATAYDVMVGAYCSKKEAAKTARMLSQNGYKAEIVSP
ncbi:MAG: SPOR domain-containing protein [Desulfobacterales bacterium]|nr:SPOR domain-containing protein [Desulfobacterales bacterium]